MPRVSVVAFGSALIAAALPARANDSSASIGAGGLQLVPNSAVSLEREDLTIAPDRVTVRYVFHNQTAADFDTLVAFPLPPIDLSQMYETDFGMLGTESDNYIGFSVSVDGQPVEPMSESRATVIGHDVTARLAEFDLPTTGFDVAMLDRLAALPPADRATLQAEGIAQFDDYGGTVTAFPTWTFQTIYYWPQHFPANSDVVIEHSYRPIAGGALFGAVDAETIMKGDDEAWDRFCLDANLLQQAAARAGTGYLRAWTVDYIVTTANNWAGPIGSFHLTIDKGAADWMAAACVAGLAETGPTTLEATIADFTPRGELAVLFLEGAPLE
ncbi:MAG: DUF4424 family protein [Alphaproteobacteria bacterium]